MRDAVSASGDNGVRVVGPYRTSDDRVSLIERRSGLFPRLFFVLSR